MIEAEHIGVETQTIQGIVSVAVFHVAANWMPHIGAMHTNLIFTTGLQAKFHKTVFDCSFQRVEMRDGILAAVVDRTGISDISLVVFEPIGNGSAVFFHFA